MLSLKEFKEFEIDENSDFLSLIKGGITCEEFWRVMDYLDRHNPEQAQAIRDLFEPSGWKGFQCS